MPAISEIWRDCAVAAARAAGVECSFANVDLAAYLLIQHAHNLDVIVAPNLFGDVLADLGAVLLGSRGLSYSGNFSSRGAAVYQTNHGAALDLAGTDRANPMGQNFFACHAASRKFRAYPRSGADRKGRIAGLARRLANPGHRRPRTSICRLRKNGRLGRGCSHSCFNQGAYTGLIVLTDCT